jgi:calcineurin-like phosphoesterase family protein
MTIFFSSDPHYNHANIIKYSKRPFESVDEMNEAMVTNWNSVVKDNDDVYLLGDLGMDRKIVRYIKRLKGRIHWIVGNHDKKTKRMAEFKSLFVWIKDYHELKIYEDGIKQKIVLFHYPIASWNGMHRGSWMIHGHCHANYKPGLPHVTDKGKILDAGVDCHKFYPVSYSQVKAIMNKKKFWFVDHHGG